MLNVDSTMYNFGLKPSWNKDEVKYFKLITVLMQLYNLMANTEPQTYHRQGLKDNLFEVFSRL